MDSLLQSRRVRMRPGHKVKVVFLGLVSAILLSSFLLDLPSAAGQAAEQQVKAAMLINFARYVKWPSTAFGSRHEPIVMGVYGDPQFASVLQFVTTGKEVGGRQLQVVDCSDLQTAAKSHLLFIGSSVASNHGAIIRAMSRSSVFTIADSPGFAEAGGVANFLLVDARVRFEISKKATERAGLAVSPTLLRLAMVVD